MPPAGTLHTVNGTNDSPWSYVSLRIELSLLSRAGVPLKKCHGLALDTVAAMGELIVRARHPRVRPRASRSSAPPATSRCGDRAAAGGYARFTPSLPKTGLLVRRICAPYARNATARSSMLGQPGCSLHASINNLMWLQPCSLSRSTFFFHRRVLYTVQFEYIYTVLLCTAKNSPSTVVGSMQIKQRTDR
jgi:hypothetical protein